MQRSTGIWHAYLGLLWQSGAMFELQGFVQ